MKFRICLAVAIGLIAVINQATAQEARFFRISGPATTAITAFRTDGTMVWSNAEPGTNYIVQTSTSFPGGTNWVDYIQLPVTNGVNTNLLVDLNPPVGMALIPAGSFTMGDTLDGGTNAIPTNVTVSAFYMDVNLTSYGQWQTIYTWATNNGYGFDEAGAGKAANHPVQMVNWYDVVKWCNARSQQARLTPVYYTDSGFAQLYTNGDTDSVYPNWSASGYRLPTEAEWEKAARGGLSGQRFPWGNTISESQANYNSWWIFGVPWYSYDVSTYSGFNTNFDTGALPYTSPVGFFAGNGYGLTDMVGNVCEWCWDWYGTPYGQPTVNNPIGPTSGSSRVIRGGAFSAAPNNVRCAWRFKITPNSTANGQGFRCVRGR